MRVFVALICTSVLVACGGGSDTNSVSTSTAPVIKTGVPTPVKKATTVTGGNAVVIHMYQALYGMAPSNALLLDYSFQANNDASTFVKNLTDRFASTNHTDLAKLVLDNLGVTPTTVAAINAKGESEYALLLDAVKQIFSAFPTMRGQVILNMTNLLAGLESDATYGAAAVAYNGQAKGNLTYSSNAANSNTAASSSQDVACSVQGNNYGDVAFPSEYQGTFPMPTPIGRLPPTMTRSIALKDDFPTKPISYPYNARYVPPTGCTDQELYGKNLYVETINRIQHDGADQIWIFNYGAWDDLTKPIYSVPREGYLIGDSVLKFAVDEAKKRNLKVYFTWQFQSYDSQGNSIPPMSQSSPISSSDLKRMMDSWRQLIVDRATYANQIGIDGIAVDNTVGPIISPEQKEYYVTEMVSIINDIRKVYSGKVVYGAGRASISNEPSSPVFYDSRFISKVDQLIINVSPGNITNEENINISVSLFKNRAADIIKNAKTDFDKQMNGAQVDIPIIWFTTLYSYASNSGFIEDAYCTDRNSQPSDTICVQRTTPTSFSKQANAIEGSLEAISEQHSFSNNNSSVYIDNMWFNDDMAPRADNGTGFPNLSRSIRNKPAESIVRYWFGR